MYKINIKKKDQKEEIYSIEERELNYNHCCRGDVKTCSELFSERFSGPHLSFVASNNVATEINHFRVDT